MCKVRHLHLILRDDRVQLSERTAVDGSDEIGADLNTLLFLLVRDKYQYPSGGLLLKAQVLVENSMDTGNRCPIGQSLDAQLAVFHNGSSNRGNKSKSPDRIFAVQVVFAMGIFAILHFLDNGIN
jgi:hypothetical protein